MPFQARAFDMFVCDDLAVPCKSAKRWLCIYYHILFYFFFCSNLSSVLRRNAATRKGSQLEVPTSYILGLNLGASWCGRYTLLFALITNYVYWMFSLVSSAHAMGCQEEKYGGETSTGRGEHQFMLRNLIDIQLYPETRKFIRVCDRLNNTC